MKATLLRRSRALPKPSLSALAQVWRAPGAPGACGAAWAVATTATESNTAITTVRIPTRTPHLSSFGGCRLTTRRHSGLTRASWLTHCLRPLRWVAWGSLDDQRTTERSRWRGGRLPACVALAARVGPPRRAGPCHRSRHGEHACVRARAGDRGVGAVRGGDRLPDRRRARRGGGGAGHDRPHAGRDHRGATAPPRRDRRLRGDRADAAPLHRPRSPQPAGTPTRDDLRALRHHRRGAARPDGGEPRRGRPLGAPDRGVAGRGHRRRTGHRRATGQRGGGRGRRHERGGRDLTGRHRGLPFAAHRRVRPGRDRGRLAAQHPRPGHRRDHGGAGEAGRGRGQPGHHRRDPPPSAGATRCRAFPAR